MLVIRERQLRALGRAALARWLADHLKRFFPERCEELGERGLREEVAHGLDRATTYGFSSGDQLAQYLDLMFTLGRDFDRDPALGWAAEILSDRAAGARMRRLCEAALKHLGVDAALEAGD